MENNKISVVLPCLNEEKTIEYCIQQAFTGIRKSGLQGEVIVADNGSSDSSVLNATQAGARIVHVDEKGYGSALRGGIEAAENNFIILGDADSTYNFEHIEKFVTKLDDGFELVVGNRFKGGIEKGAMPLLNKYLGNPVLSFIAKKLFNSNIGDFNCGLRGFTKKAYEEMDLKSTGMEFATEMIAKSALLNLKIDEVPTTLNVSISERKPHLKPFRDGIRLLKLMLTYSFIKLFNIGFNLGLFIFIPLYFGVLFFSPFKIFEINISLGTLNTLENILLIFLILRSMLKISSNLFPYFLENTSNISTSSNFGIIYLFLGILFYIIDFLYWTNFNFGIINQVINLKLISVGSLFFTFGLFELFRLFIETSTDYFKEN